MTTSRLWIDILSKYVQRWGTFSNCHDKLWRPSYLSHEFANMHRLSAHFRNMPIHVFKAATHPGCSKIEESSPGRKMHFYQEFLNPTFSQAHLWAPLRIMSHQCLGVTRLQRSLGSRQEPMPKPVVREGHPQRNCSPVTLDRAESVAK